jgi:hypothetical protein
MIDVKQGFERFLQGLNLVSAETLGWLAVLMLHASTVPMLMSLLSGLSDRMPPLDMLLPVYGGLVALFLQSLVRRNLLQIATIAAGFVMQATLVAMIFFK